ncbi:hypothetical protein SAMN06265361_103347 [Laceyella tengchongensis]|uniref:Uncharacterized protein n=1 Tax=Laceyella tengchongensis TaxID=574699 RepID=A0AA46AFI9_9BACL|nr:hypothetical protein SAMN06265361_103347 [Laceyella tengchongensis]
MSSQIGTERAWIRPEICPFLQFYLLDYKKYYIIGLLMGQNE